uniref:TIGR00270 family protein n=1 Tax=Staphylothermus marinus TaxID=2280 RepID=A0A7C4H6Z1_STAMA
MTCYCEICGRHVEDSNLCRTVTIYNSVLTVCPNCYKKIVGDKQPAIQQTLKQVVKPTSSEPDRDSKWIKTKVSRKILETMYEVVEDYATRIKRAREKMGWNQTVLAQKLRVSENIVKRIESGKLKPSIELARKLEKLLGIVLLEPIVDETLRQSSGDKSEDYLTIGDLINTNDEK